MNETSLAQPGRELQEAVVETKDEQKQGILIFRAPRRTSQAGTPNLLSGHPELLKRLCCCDAALT